MANLNRVVYLSEEQKNTLFSTGSVTSGATTITYNENDLYITPQEYDNAPTSGSNNLITSGAIYSAISNAPGYNKVGTVTSVQVQATSPVLSSTSTSQTGSLNTTISLADGYGDTKNPYTPKFPNYVLAGPSSGTATAVPTFRVLVEDDMPYISSSKIFDRYNYFSLKDDDTWVNLTPNSTNKDLNNYTEAGNYYFTNTLVGNLLTGKKINNVPNVGIRGIGTGILKVMNCNNKTYQLLIAPKGDLFNDNIESNKLAVYIRYYTDDSWSDWVELTNEQEYTGSVLHGFPVGYQDLSTPNEYLWQTNEDYQNFIVEMYSNLGYEFDEDGLVIDEYLPLSTIIDNLFIDLITKITELQQTTLQYDFGGDGYPQHDLTNDPTYDMQVATKHYVDQGFAANDAMIFKGTLAGAATTTYTPAAERGHTYKVSTAGLINGEKVEVGDMLICITDATAAATSSNVSTIKNNWAIVQTNLDGAVIGPVTATNNAIALFNNAGNLIKDSTKTITTTTSTSASTDTTIPTSKAVWNTINNYVKKSGDTMTGNLNFNSTASVVLTSAAAAYNSGALKFTSGGVIGGDNSGDIGVYATKIYLRPGNSTTSSGLGVILGTTGSGSSLMVQLDPHATNKVNLGTSSLRYNDIYATNINISKIQAPTQSGGSTYGVGSANQVLKTNGTTVYWGSESIPESDEIVWNGGNFGANPAPSTVEDAITTVYNAIVDTKNTVGSTQSTSKVYLVGPTTQSASAQSYSHTAVYAQDGAMAATSYKVAEKVILQYDTTTDALNFVFA